jgi:hypothetical protein
MNNVNVPRQPTGTNHFQFRFHQLGLGVSGTVGGFCSMKSFYFSPEAWCNHSFKGYRQRISSFVLHAACLCPGDRCRILIWTRRSRLQTSHSGQSLLFGTACRVKRGPSTLFCRRYARNERSNRFARRLPHRAPRSGSCSAGRPAPARGSRIRNYRMCDVFRLRPLQTPCHIHSRKLRM